MKKGVVGCLVLALSLAGLGVATDDQIAVAAYLVRRITLAPDYIDCWEGVGMCKCQGDISDIRESLRKDGHSWKPRCGLDSGAETQRL